MNRTPTGAPCERLLMKTEAQGSRGNEARTWGRTRARQLPASWLEMSSTECRLRGEGQTPQSASGCVPNIRHGFECLPTTVETFCLRRPPLFRPPPELSLLPPAPPGKAAERPGVFLSGLDLPKDPRVESPCSMWEGSLGFIQERRERGRKEGKLYE